MRALLTLLMVLSVISSAHAQNKWQDKDEKITPVSNDILLIGDSENIENSVPSSKTITRENWLKPLDITPTGDDAGVNIMGQLSTGEPMNGREAVFGEGDSYPVVGAWHCDLTNFSGNTVTGCSDITTILQSDDGSTTTMFPAATAGSVVMIYSDLGPFAGAKVKVDTGATVEPANILAEYLQTTATWESESFMSADADDLEQLGNVLASRDNTSEQWRFGFDPTNLPGQWDQETFSVNGSDYTGWFSRFRVTSTISGNPIIQQVKLHTNRFEVNANGKSEYFGDARYPKTIQIVQEPNQAKNPANQNITIAPDFTILRVDNEFNNGAEDGFILSGVVPDGLDTSIPVQVIIDWYPNTNGAGDVELELEVVVANDNFVYDGTATPVAATPVITTIAANSLEEKQRSTFVLDVSAALPQQRVYGSMFRDASGGNPDDTLSGSIVITDWQVLGYFWKP